VYLGCYAPELLGTISRLDIRPIKPVTDASNPGSAMGRFEALIGDRKGQYSIRINDQWRVCFDWDGRSPGPSNVEIVDYH